MALFQTLKYIYTHPLNSKDKLGSISNFFRWQLSSRLLGYPVIYPFVGNTFLFMKKGLAGATGNFYCGLHEFEDMSFTIHLLREGDQFVDIGANIGSFSILASGVAGANTLAIEPVPVTYQILNKNIAINGLADKVKTLNIAIGNEVSEVKFTSDLDTVNHIVSEKETSIANFITVPLKPLDSVVSKIPVLMKIDVEGFEANVLKGAESVLSNPTLAALIIELNGSGEKYGFSDLDLHKSILERGFLPYIYHPFERRLEEITTPTIHFVGNIIYIRDYAFVSNRIKTAPQFIVKGQAI